MNLIAIYEDEKNFIERSLEASRKYLSEMSNRAVRNSIMQTIKINEERLEKINARLWSLENK